jgi:lantibiotic modifying enzyme
MVSIARTGVFLDEASRIGRLLARSAIRHEDRATWIGDAYVESDGAWRRAARTIEGDVAYGTAGVGSFLAHLAVATHDASARDVAGDALRHSLAQGDVLLERAKLGWYDGALGVAANGMRCGRLLAEVELVAHASRLADRAIGLARPPRDPSPQLLDGAAGVMAGLMSVANTSPDARVAERAMRAAGEYARALCAVLDEPPRHAVGPPPAGFAVGRSGLGFVLAAWAACGDEDALHAALAAFDDERRWFQPGEGWWCVAAHPWMEWDPESRTGSPRAWCAGAAGIGVARLLAYVLSREQRFLAEAVAAIELVRDGVHTRESDDSSVCHGSAGEIELLLSAASLLGEPAHLAAARSAGHARVARARAEHGYGSGLWPGARSPALLHGLAGIGHTLLRLHDPRSAPSPALPPCLMDGSAEPLTA